MACQYSEQSIPEEAQKPPSKVVTFAVTLPEVNADLEEAKEPAQTRQARSRKAAKTGKAKKKSTAGSQASAPSSEDGDAADDEIDRALNDAAISQQQEKPASKDEVVQGETQAAQKRGRAKTKAAPKAPKPAVKPSRSTSK